MNQYQKFWEDRAFVATLVMYLLLVLVYLVMFTGCASEPSRPFVLLVAEDGNLVLPEGTIVTRPGHEPWTAPCRMLMLTEDSVSNLQARGYLP